MNYTPEHYADKPNLLRLARVIAAGRNPERVVNALFQMLANCAGTEPPAPFPEGQTNNERFNDLLNSCQNPQAVYDMLAAVAERRQVER